MIVSVSYLQGLIAEYLVGVLDLESFSGKFALVFDNIEQSGDEDAIQLSYQIESNLADVSAGFASEEQLRESLEPLLSLVKVNPSYEKKLDIQKEEARSAKELPEWSYA